METNKLKKFAVDARNKLKAGVAAKMLTLGFDRNGNVPEHLHPQLMQGGSLWNGQLQTESFYHQWNALYNRIKQKGIKEVYEEAAYTWFNRLVAIRILQKNGIIEPVLDYVDAARTPRIVDEARMGRMPQMQEVQRIRLLELLDDDARIKDQFAVLIAAYCHQSPILNACFGSLDDYTELLLPNDILTEGGFVDMLNHTEFITDTDFQSPELIGWLYQFYISERKDEVFVSFKKGNKAEAEDIPAATQIFTPNWIVKYMVQNTIGRIYLDNHPSAAVEFKPKWKYLVEPSEATPKATVYQFKELTELLVGDLACGSGHILNECFDLLYDLYIYEGYSRREAVENIFAHNLRGVDLDTRAKQLSQFALLLKACQKDHSFADAHVLPKVLDMPKKKEYRLSDLSEFMQSAPSDKSVVELSKAFELMKDADSLGSVMIFDISETTRIAIAHAVDYWHSQSFIPNQVVDLLPSIDLIQTMTNKYTSLIANPPYMGRGNMNDVLSSYLAKFYPDAKQDLFASFMQMMINKTIEKGRTAFITMESWMFLSSFEKMRKRIIDNYYISSMGHFGWHIIGIAFGTVMTILEKQLPNGRKGEYSFLTIDDIDRSLNAPVVFPKKDNGRFSHSDQLHFEKIPGSPIGYWVSENALTCFSESNIDSLSPTKRGLQSGDVNYFSHMWYEVAATNIEWSNQIVDNKNSSKEWCKFTNGGNGRKWYGNLDLVVKWKNNGQEIKETGKAIIPNEEMYFMPCAGYNRVTSTGLKARYYYQGILCGDNTPFSVDNGYAKLLVGLLNSVVSNFFISILNPTMAAQSGSVRQIPFVTRNRECIEAIIESNITISMKDWDAHELSWDFGGNPIVSLLSEIIACGCLDSSFKLSIFVKQFKTIWEERFYQLHQNEEELNRQFIDIYGLQDELTPDVPLDEITILQQGEISIRDNKLIWNDDVLMKQLISYAVGVWMGRYKLGKKGLHIAHPEPTDRELQEYWYGGEQVFIDDDAIIPILPQNSPFDDNLSSRIADFIRIVFGAETLTENLNCIEKMLGTTIDQYVQKDFWKDHKKMYQNRPIYWLFSSKKGAFKCLTYMHRMDPYTSERVRSNYLLPYIEYLQNQIGDLENHAAALTTAENRKLTNLHKALDECQEYHERLQVVAEQAIGFDLDDGVLVNYAKFGDVLAKIK